MTQQPLPRTDTTPTPLVETILWGTSLSSNTIKVYFAEDGTSVDGTPYPPRLSTIDAERWTEYEIGQFQQAFDAIEAVIDVQFVQVNTMAQADLTVVVDTDEVLGDFLGLFYPPGTENEGVGIFDGTLWDRGPGGDLEKGGFGYVTVVHELLHGLGLAHPHDNGGGSSIMPGVSGEADPGDNLLNQGVYTTMSYNSGYVTGGPATAPTGDVGVNHGFEAGPMALDIAALQSLYGANTSHAGGDDVYDLPTANRLGTYWSSIWDTGGTDTIRHAGALGATIDLRAATLAFEEGGGGFLSLAEGIKGGFTIAHGVEIENAIGGDGADVITGNALANRLEGGAGFDTMHAGSGDDTVLGQANADLLHGGGGDDLIEGGAGFDNLHGEAGNDTLRAGDDPDRAWGGAGDDLIYGGANSGATRDGLFGEDGDDTLYGERGNDHLGGMNGNDLLFGGGQSDNLYGGAGNDTLRGDYGRDRLYAGAGNDRANGGSEADTIYGGAGSDTLIGESGRDLLYGGSGNDKLSSGSEADTLFAGAGADTLASGGANDLMHGEGGSDLFRFADGHGADTIADFDAADGAEKISLSDVTAITGLSDLLGNHATQSGADVVIDTGGGNSITLSNVALADLDAGDFIF